MKKFIIICLGFVLLSMGNVNARWPAATGPYPVPYNPQPNQTIAPYPLTPQQRPYVRQAFTNMQTAFQQNHRYCCSRGDCLRMDYDSLLNFINTKPYHPATPLFRR